MYKFSKRSIQELELINPKLAALMDQAIKRSPIDFGIPNNGGKRTAEKQNELYNKGVSKCDGILKKSYHQSGNAVDVYAYVNGQASWEVEHLCIIAGVVLSIASEMRLKIRWGGTFGSNEFKGWDMPHFEIKD
jgi:peptidoglycan L-alanyl-D-glutamate endopeptidase CwlK